MTTRLLNTAQSNLWIRFAQRLLQHSRSVPTFRIQSKAVTSAFHKGLGGCQARVDRGPAFGTLQLILDFTHNARVPATSGRKACYQAEVLDKERSAVSGETHSNKRFSAR